MNSQSFILETERLYLRPMAQADFEDLCLMLKDPVVMAAYEHAFDDAEVQDWLDRQLRRYQDYGFGLWAVVLKESGRMIGQCGLTMQECNGEQVPEIGYLFQKAFWHQGYAIEAASACKRYAFDVLGAEEVFSIIRDTNIPSQHVAERNGMVRRGSFVKYYYHTYMLHFIFSITRAEYEKAEMR